MNRAVRLTVNDQEIRLNSFVRKVFINTLLALTKTLDNVPDDVKKISLEIKNEEE